MRYDSSPQTSKAIGILFGTVATVFLYFALVVAAGIAAFVLLLISFLGILLTLAAVTARYSVIVNLQDARIEKRFHTLFFNRSTNFPLSKYRGVGIGTGGRGGDGAPTIVYFVQLLGPRNLQITSASGDRDKTCEEARALSAHIDLPLID